MKNNITCGEAVDRYIESKIAVLSPSTIKGYKDIRRNHIGDLENVNIKLITTEILQRTINKMARTYSPKTIRNIYGLIHATLKMFRPNCTYNISLPQKIKTTFYIPEKREIEHIYTIIKTTHLELPFLLAVQCGLRPSEISAITKDCITNSGLVIQKAVVLDEYGREIYKAPKSYAGYRTIPISHTLRSKLLNAPDKRICPYTSKKISRDWHKFLIRNKLHPFRFYALRHYFASQSLLLGIPQKYIAEIMGHSSTAMIEQVYQHTFPSAMLEFKKRISENAEELFKI